MRYYSRYRKSPWVFVTTSKSLVLIPLQEPPVCQHCKQYGFECTFFLPITETRFKKKKMEEEAAEKDKAESSRSVSSPNVETQSKREVGVFGMLLVNFIFPT